MGRFFMSPQLAFFAKTSRWLEITKVPCFAGFLSTGRVWGASRGLEPLALRMDAQTDSFRICHAVLRSVHFTCL